MQKKRDESDAGEQHHTQPQQIVPDITKNVSVSYRNSGANLETGEEIHWSRKDKNSIVVSNKSKQIIQVKTRQCVWCSLFWKVLMSAGLLTGGDAGMLGRTEGGTW